MYSIHSHYKGNHKRGAAAGGRGISFVVAAINRVDVFDLVVDLADVDLDVDLADVLFVDVDLVDVDLVEVDLVDVDHHSTII